MSKLINISQIDIYHIQPQAGLIGFTNFLIDEAIAINGVGIYERLDGTGIRLVYPVRTLANGKQINLVHPISQGVGSFIQQQVADHLLNYKNFGDKDAETKKTQFIK